MKITIFEGFLLKINEINHIMNNNVNPKQEFPSKSYGYFGYFKRYDLFKLLNDNFEVSY